MNDKKIEEEIEIPVVINENSTQIYCTGAFGGFTPYDFRINLFNEKFLPSLKNDGDMTLVRESEYQLVMSPLSALQLHDWLSKKLKDYQEQIGPINVPGNEE